MAGYNAGTPGTQHQRSRRAVDSCAQFESPTVRALNSSRPCLAAPAPETATESLRTRCAHTLEVDRASGAGMPRVRRLVRVNGAPQGTVQCQLPDCDWLRLQFHTFFLAAVNPQRIGSHVRRGRHTVSVLIHRAQMGAVLCTCDGRCSVYP